MPTLPGLVLQLIEAAWSLSLEFLPLMYLGFLLYAFTQDQQDTALATVIRSQLSYPLHYGTFLVTGLLIGAVPVISMDGLAGAVIGGDVAFAALIYGYLKIGLPERTELDLETWPDRLKLPWTVVPVLAAASIATGDPLLKSLTALVFLSTIFWKV